MVLLHSTISTQLRCFNNQVITFIGCSPMNKALEFSQFPHHILIHSLYRNLDLSRPVLMLYPFLPNSQFTFALLHSTTFIQHTVIQLNA